MIIRPKSFFVFFLLFCSYVTAEQMKIEMIPMQSRVVEDVIPIIKPLVIPGGSVTGMNNQLIVKTTPSNLQEIKEVLKQIDNPPRKLMISVKQGVQGRTRMQERVLSGRYQSENVVIDSPDTGRGGTIIQGGDENSVLRYRQKDNTTSSDENNVFRVQALEGYPAKINIGQSIPYQSRQAYLTHDGVVVQDSTEFQDVNSGFYVLPRLSGNNVTLVIAPRLSRTSKKHPGTIETQDIQTTASGRLGEWITIGGISQSSNRDGNRNLSRNSSSSDESREVMIKVEEIR